MARLDGGGKIRPRSHIPAHEIESNPGAIVRSHGFGSGCEIRPGKPSALLRNRPALTNCAPVGCHASSVAVAAARIAARPAILRIRLRFYPIWPVLVFSSSNCMTRRQLLSAAAIGLGGSSFALPQQYRGMASGGITPAPRGKPSGPPFHAKFVNVAAQAGLHAPIVYGNEGHVDYILDAMGCGVAFLDYDNDGWLDVGDSHRQAGEWDRRMTRRIRLYRNNRDGTFSDVTAAPGLGRSVWAAGITIGDYDNDGFDDLFITCWGQNILFHNNGDGTFMDVTGKAGLTHPGAVTEPAAPGSTTIAMASWISSSTTTWLSTRTKFPSAV